MGLPTKRDEYWHYTDPAAFNAAQAKPAALGDTAAVLFAGLDAVKLVFVDGVFDAAASDDLTLSGVSLSRLASAPAGHWAQTYGALEAAGQSPIARPWAAFNTAFASDGLLIHVTDKAAKPVSVIYLRRDDAADVVLHHVIKLDAGAEFTLLEQGPAAARLNHVIEVDLAQGARFHHIRAQGRDLGRHVVSIGQLLVVEVAAFLGQQLVFQVHRAGAGFLEGAGHMHDVQRFAIAGIAIDQHRQAGGAADLTNPEADIVHRDHTQIRQAHGRGHGGAGEIERLEPRPLGQQRG
jgi:Fe-S cluster assembly protein SufD